MLNDKWTLTPSDVLLVLSQEELRLLTIWVTLACMKLVIGWVSTTPSKVDVLALEMVSLILLLFLPPTLDVPSNQTLVQVAGFDDGYHAERPVRYARAARRANIDHSPAGRNTITRSIAIPSTICQYTVWPTAYVSR